MTRVSGAAVCLSRIVFGGGVGARGMRPSGMLPSAVVVVEIATSLGCAAGCNCWCCCQVVSVAKFAGWCCSYLFTVLLDSEEFVAQQ